jgi:hypothetical protein
MALRDTLRIIVLRFVAQRLVTPFTPYVLADAFLASEVHKYGLRGLNPRAVDLAQSDLSTVSANPVLFVQVNQLDDFCRDVLPKIVGPFTLITGKWHLPALQRSDYVTTILGSRHLNRWYSQNQVFDELPILPFPYGVKLSSAPHVYWRMRLRRVLGLGRSGVFVPHVAAHEHLDGVALEARRQLEGVMGPRLKLTTYLNKILRHKFVISPPGDRMDTYRHWESIALGAIPVSNLPRGFADLFGTHTMGVAGFHKDFEREYLQASSVKNPRLATVNHWRKHVLGAK